MIRVAVYDDNIERREGLKALISLTSDLELVGSYEHAANIIHNVSETMPDVILMDIEMPGGDGLSALQTIRQGGLAVKVIMQTVFDDDERLFKAMQLGAEGYILKSASVSQILEAINEVNNGGASMTPSIALKVMRFFNTHTQTHAYNLTPKETEVLKHLASGLSYKMIADKLGISYFTVNNHIKNIYEKLQVHSLGEAVSLALKNKLV